MEHLQQAPYLKAGNYDMYCGPNWGQFELFITDSDIDHVKNGGVLLDYDGEYLSVIRYQKERADED